MTSRGPPRPEPAALADRHDALHRIADRQVDDDRFATLRERVDAGFEWGVGGLAIDEAGRVLLVFENGRWLLPGGVVETDESLEAALAREVAEEIGLSVSVGELLAVTEQGVSNGSRRVEFRFAIFAMDPDDPVAEPSPAEATIDAASWHETLPASTLDRSFIRQLRDG